MRLKFLFGFGGRVDRSTYLRYGLLLMLLKYFVDAAVIATVTGVIWAPWDYLVPLWSLRGEKLEEFSAGLALFLLLWMLPFLWVDMSLTLRRLVDAGREPWLVLLFFIPFLNYLLMLLLVTLPTGRLTASTAAIHVGSAKR